MLSKIKLKLSAKLEFFCLFHQLGKVENIGFCQYFIPLWAKRVGRCMVWGYSHISISSYILLFWSGPDLGPYQIQVKLKPSANWLIYAIVIVTPCSVSLAIRQSPDKTGYLTQHRKPPRFKGKHLFICIYQTTVILIHNMVFVKMVRLVRWCHESKWALNTCQLFGLNSVWSFIAKLGLHQKLNCSSWLHLD